MHADRVGHSAHLDAANPLPQLVHVAQRVSQHAITMIGHHHNETSMFCTADWKVSGSQKQRCYHAHHTPHVPTSYETRNPKPYTLHPTPSTRNPKSQTLHPSTSSTLTPLKSPPPPRPNKTKLRPWLSCRTPRGSRGEPHGSRA